HPKLRWTTEKILLFPRVFDVLDEEKEDESLDDINRLYSEGGDIIDDLSVILKDSLLRINQRKERKSPPVSSNASKVFKRICYIFDEKVIKEGQEIKTAILKAEILQQLLLFISTIPFENIIPEYAKTLETISTIHSWQDDVIHNNVRIIQTLTRLLKHFSENVVNSIAATIDIIITQTLKDKTNEIKEHPLFRELNSEGIIQLMFQDGIIEATSEQVQQLMAIAIVQLYIGQQLPENMSLTVITRLKEGLNGLNEISNKAFHILTELSNDNSNHQRFIVAGVIETLSVESGGKNIQDKIFSSIATDVIRGKIQKENPNVTNSALKLLAWSADTALMKDLHIRKEKIDNYPPEMKAKFANEQYLQEIIELFRSIEARRHADLEWAELTICIMIGEILHDSPQGCFVVIEKTDFVKQILKIIRRKAPNALHSAFLIPIWQITNLSSVRNLQTLFSWKVIQILGPHLESADEGILYNTTFIIERVLRSGCVEVDDGYPNQYLLLLEKDDSIDQLQSLFRRSSSVIPFCLSNELVQWLKQYVYDESNEFYLVSSLTALAGLSECEANHKLILSNSFISAISKIIKNNQESNHKFKCSLMLLRNLLQYGKFDTRKQVVDQIPLKKIVSYAHSNEGKLNKVAVSLAQLLLITSNNPEDKKMAQLMSVMAGVEREKDWKQIAKLVAIKEITPLLQYSLQYIQYYDELCKMLVTIINNDRATIDAIMKSNIPVLLGELLKSISNAQIDDIHITSLFNIIYYAKEEQKHALFNMHISRVLQQVIMNPKTTEDDAERLERVRTISAQALAFLYEGIDLPAKVRELVIVQLIVGMNNRGDEEMMQKSLEALSELSKNKDNIGTIIGCNILQLAAKLIIDCSSSITCSIFEMMINHEVNRVAKSALILLLKISDDDGIDNEQEQEKEYIEITSKLKESINMALQQDIKVDLLERGVFEGLVWLLEKEDAKHIILRTNEFTLTHRSQSNNDITSQLQLENEQKLQIEQETEKDQKAFDETDDSLSKIGWIFEAIKDLINIRSEYISDMIKSGLIKEIFSFFDAFPLNKLSHIHFQTLIVIIKSCTKEDLHEIFELGGVQGIIKLLQYDDAQTQSDITTAICAIIRSEIQSQLDVQYTKVRYSLSLSSKSFGMFNTIYIRNQIVEQLHAEVMQTTKPALIKMRVAIV
ncbi:MAG: hypothetical protein EZS28_026808, partial [Streblomastix strix]